MNNADSEIRPYNPAEDMAFSSDRCFLCGISLTDNKTEEHVFPKWLLNKYNLWNEKIGLLNGTDIPYKQLTIPSCLQCNGEYLSQLEKTVAAAAEKGYAGFTNLDEIVLFQWMTKIFYGLQFRELSLLTNRRYPHAGTIVTEEQLEAYRFLHNLLQSIRLPYKFEGRLPWSIFLYETHEYGDGRDFDYHDAAVPCTFSIRLGNVGIIAALSDHGAIRGTYSDILYQYRGHKLHPMQFQQVAAEVHYNALLLNRTPHYVFVSGEETKDTTTTHVYSIPIEGYSSKPIFDDWDYNTFARVLWSYWSEWGFKLQDIITEDGRVWNVLMNENGDFNDIPANVLLISPITKKRALEPAD